MGFPILGRGPGAVQADSNTKTKIRAKQSPLSAPTSGCAGRLHQQQQRIQRVISLSAMSASLVDFWPKKRHDPHGTSMIIQSGKLISRNLQVSNVEKLSLMLFRPTARSATGPRRKRSRGCPRTCRRVAMCTLNAWGPLPTQGRCQGQNCGIVGPFHVSIESTRNGKR